jgi:hypothetical protein
MLVPLGLALFSSLAVAAHCFPRRSRDHATEQANPAPQAPRAYKPEPACVASTPYQSASLCA